jgi:hypothetical protein
LSSAALDRGSLDRTFLLEPMVAHHPARQHDVLSCDAEARAPHPAVPEQLGDGDLRRVDCGGKAEWPDSSSTGTASQERGGRLIGLR